MEAIVLFSALFLMPVIAFFFMFRFLKHFSKQKEGIALTSFLFALIFPINNLDASNTTVCGDSCFKSNAHPIPFPGL
ncbi:hypothetical protein [Lysinibacillus pakistanensis]|uniref:hypothetical protein n=1 Tax=Lysinibacillus pakistanensis TaxID=759811 RepID=UPI003D28B081